GQPIAGWVSLPVDDYGARRDLAQAAATWRDRAVRRDEPLGTPDLALVAVRVLAAPAAPISDQGATLGRQLYVEGNPLHQRTPVQQPGIQVTPRHLRLLRSLAR